MDREPLPSNHNPMTILTAKFISGFKFIREQLRVADLDPHEGLLRTSIAPEQFLEIPDFPPES